MKLCPGVGGYWDDRKWGIGRWWQHEGYNGYNHRPIRGVYYPKMDEWAAKMGELPVGIKRVRITCELCGRRMMAAYRVCDDGCCLFYFVPPHKPKMWWKKGKPRKNRDRKKMG